MASSEIEVLNLLYKYADYMDAGDRASAERLFTHARIKVAGEKGDQDGTIDAAGLRALWERFQIMYAGGTLRTKHVITNPIVEVNEAAGTATIRSWYTVFQATDGFPLQPIIVGRYLDSFERVDQVWRYSARVYPPADLIGDTSRHGREPIPQ
jgi:hypothetical protein